MAALNGQTASLRASPREVWDVAEVTPRTKVYASTACDHDATALSPDLPDWFDDVTGWLRVAR